MNPEKALKMKLLISALLLFIIAIGFYHWPLHH